MLKFDNTCTEYPNMTRVLDEMPTAKERHRTYPRPSLKISLAAAETVSSKRNAMNICPPFSPSCTRRMRWNLVMKNSPV